MTQKIDYSGYRGMWLFALFDLPVTDVKLRRRYTRFRNHLLKHGFTMIQFSVYARFCRNEERAAMFRKQIRKGIPPEGQVRLLTVTDKQYGKMEVFSGKTKVKTEEPPEQLLLF